MIRKTFSFKEILNSKKPQIGMWASLNSSIACEMLAGSGLDFIVVDMEHTSTDHDDLLNMLQAINSANGAYPAMRVPWNDHVMIKRALDNGAENIIIPYIQTPLEAEKAAKAMRYPPTGNRGVAGSTRANNFGREENYFENAEKYICTIVQIESAKAVQASTEIASVEGVDAVFVGPGDLAADLGVIENRRDPKVLIEINNVAVAANKAGVPAGIMASSIEEAREYLDSGFSFVSLATDLVHLRNATKYIVESFED